MFANNSFNKGIILTSIGSFWWGFLGVIYFKFIAYAGPVEVVAHRSIWTTVTLLITTVIFSKWFKLKIIFQDKKKIIYSFSFWVINFYKLVYMDLCGLEQSSYRCKLWIFYNANNKYIFWIFFF